MAFCSACGAELGPNAAFCPKCGKPTAQVVNSPSTVSTSGTGLQENIAGLLCYVLGWITGVLFFLIDKRPFVRFHAMQSIMTFGALNVLHWILVWSGWFGRLGGLLFVGILSAAIGVVTFVCWVVCMVKAYQGQRFKLPVVGDLAETYSK
jgi:uncharacterized membrane protein